MDTWTMINFSFWLKFKYKYPFAITHTCPFGNLHFHKIVKIHEKQIHKQISDHILNAKVVLQSWKYIVGTPDAIYYNYPHAHHCNRKLDMTLFNRKQRGSRFTIILPSPHQINVGGLGKVSDNMTRINIA